MIAMTNLAVLLFKLSQDSLLKTEYGLSPLHSWELPGKNSGTEKFLFWRELPDFLFWNKFLRNLYVEKKKILENLYFEEEMLKNLYFEEDYHY